MAARIVSVALVLLVPMGGHALVLSPTHASLSQSSTQKTPFEATVGGCTCDMQQLECLPSEGCLHKFMEESPRLMSEGVQMRKSLKMLTHFDGNLPMRQPVGKMLQYGAIKNFKSWLADNTIARHMDQTHFMDISYCHGVDTCLFRDANNPENMASLELEAVKTGATALETYSSHSFEDLRNRINRGVSTADESLVSFAQLTRLMFNEKPAVRAAYDSHVAQVHPGMGKLRVALHVRRADACMHRHSGYVAQAAPLNSAPQMSTSRSCYNTSVYVDKLAEIYDQYKVPLQVYLSTDDSQNVLDEIKGEFKLHQTAQSASAMATQRAALMKSVLGEIQSLRSDIYDISEFRYLNYPRSDFEYTGFVEGDDMVPGQQAFMTETAIGDLWHMSHAQFFVGSLGSRFGKVAYLLAVARHNSAIPYSSVDGHNLCCEIDEQCDRANTGMKSMTDCLAYAHELDQPFAPAGSSAGDYWQHGAVRPAVTGA